VAEREMQGQHLAARLLAELGNRCVSVLGFRQTTLDVLAREATLRDEDGHIEPPSARACLARYKRNQRFDISEMKELTSSSPQCSKNSGRMRSSLGEGAGLVSHRNPARPPTKR
jgi:hypothetical protein